MKRALALTACTIALLAGCGDDEKAAAGADKSVAGMSWLAETPARRADLCASIDTLGLTEAAKAWEASWNGDGSIDDDAIAEVLEEKCA